MRKIITFALLSLGALLGAWCARPVHADPAPLGVGIGVTWSADFAGNGSAGSPIELSATVTMPGVATIAGTAGTTTLQVYSTDRNAIYSERHLTASTQDDRSAVYGYSYGTMAVASGHKYNYGVRGESVMTNSTVGGSLHDWGVFGRAGTESGSPNVAYETIGVDGGGFEGTAYSVGGSFRGSSQNGVTIGAYGQGDSAHASAPSFGVYGYARTGNNRVGVIGDAAAGGGTSNIGVWARLGVYTETVPAGSYALYTDGVSKFTDDATFEDDTCVINSLGITCGGTLITPGADITSVTANAPISGGGASGAVSIGLTTCSNGEVYQMAGGVWTCTALSSGITNSAGNNVITKSNGTNLVASSATDDGTTFAINTNKLTVVESSGNTAIAGTLAVTSTVSGSALTANSGNITATSGGLLATSGTVRTNNSCIGNSTATSAGCPALASATGSPVYFATVPVGGGGFANPGAFLLNLAGTDTYLQGTVSGSGLFRLEGQRLAGTLASPTLPADGDSMLYIIGDANRAAGSLTMDNAAYIVMKVDGTPAGTAGNMPSRVEVYTSASTGGLGPVRRWYVNASGKMFALGAADIAGDFTVATNKLTVASATGNTVVAGTLGVTGDVAINTNKFNVTASSGNTTIAGTLGVTGDVAVNTNKFTVTASSGDTVVAGTFQASGNATLAGTTTLGDSGTGDKVNIKGGELVDGGTAPSSGTCGTSPTYGGGRNFFTVTPGTGSPTSCSVTFSTAFTAAPMCTITGTAPRTVYITAISTSAVTFAHTDASTMQGFTYYVLCAGDG